jgi:putative intracellular protease/amidase
MKKEVLVFIFNGYADWEPAYICSELNAPETEYTVKTLSLDKEPKTSMGGFKVLPDYSVNDFPGDFSLLILCGGLAWVEQKNNSVLPVVEYAVKKNIPVGGICNAVNFLAEHGYLDQIKHTGNTAAFMKSQAPHYMGEQNFLEKQAVCDSNIITANGSGALEFAKEILMLLKVKPEDMILEWYKLHKVGFY